jgi:hypothetical protein
MARIWLVVLLGMTVLSPNALSAQSPDDTSGPVRIGDRFTYETKDEITGDPKGTYVVVVTAVSEKEIVTNISVRGKNGSQLVVLDHDLNRIDDSLWKYKPSDGQGVQLPLSVGKTWRFEYNATNMQNGTVLRSTSVSKVVAQETVTTPAGTFETFKIERHVSQNNTVDATRGSQTDIVFWYAPTINRWVRRTFVTRIEKRVRSSSSEELTDFSRKM